MNTIDRERRYARSIEAYETACRLIPGGVNSNVRATGDPCPLTFSHASGSHIVDIDGNDYVDYAMGMGALLLGHAPSSVIRAVTSGLDTGQLFAGQALAETELARLLIKIAPSAESVRFGQSGTEMDQLALRIARAATGRRRFIRFEGHYHGWLDPLFIGPGALDSDDAITLPWNDIDALESTFSRMGADVAAVIMEPILCNVGVIFPVPGYLAAARDLCTQHGTVLIFDEVITGFRVGLTGAQGQYGVMPHLSTFAKAMGSGFPIAALAGRADLMRLVSDGSATHAGTFNANIPAVSAALATLRVLSETEPYSQVMETGARLMDLIRAVAEEQGIELAVEGLGSVFHTRFGPRDGVLDATTFAERSDARLLQRFVVALQDEGIRITSRGTWFLSTTHSSTDIDRSVVAVKRALAQVVAAQEHTPSRI